MSDPIEWPSYRIGPKDHLHAVGVLVAAWNQIERTYSAFFQLILPWENHKIFEVLGNDSRWHMINDLVAARVDPDEAEAVRFFLKCAAICKENRNAVAHAEIDNPYKGDIIRLMKGLNKERTATREYWFTLESLRAMADDCFLTSTYGLNVWSSIHTRRMTHLPPEEQAKWLVALPPKFPQPRKWDQHSREEPQAAQPQPQS